MIVGLLFLIQSVLADAGFCPTPLQGKSGGNLSVVTKDFGPFDAKKCILDQVGEPSNCKCEGIDKVFAESSLIDANDMYKQAIEEATEDAYIKSYQSAIKSIFQGTIAADVYLKDKKLKEEDLIRFNGCRPNALFEILHHWKKVRSPVTIPFVMECKCQYFQTFSLAVHLKTPLIEISFRQSTSRE